VDEADVRRDGDVPGGVPACRGEQERGVGARREARGEAVEEDLHGRRAGLGTRAKASSCRPTAPSALKRITRWKQCFQPQRLPVHASRAGDRLGRRQCRRPCPPARWRARSTFSQVLIGRPGRGAHFICLSKKARTFSGCLPK
jgi:hypothetical protein